MPGRDALPVLVGEGVEHTVVGVDAGQPVALELVPDDGDYLLHPSQTFRLNQQFQIFQNRYDKVSRFK